MHRVEWSEALSAFLTERRILLHSNKVPPRAIAHLEFDEALAIEPYTGVFAGERLPSLGAFSYTNSALPPGMRVGRYCSIGRGLGGQGFQHPLTAVSTSPWTYSRRETLVNAFMADRGGQRAGLAGAPQKPAPVLGHDVWIGDNVTLLNGIEIGNGAVVAQNAHVTRSVPPFAVVGGNPAAVIRMRFAPPVAEAIAALEWWRYDFLQFNGLDPADPQAFLAGLAGRIDTLTPYGPKPVTARDLLAFA